MKKQNESVHVDPPILKWLIGRMQEAPPSLKAAASLEDGLVHLLSGNCDIHHIPLP